MHAENVYLKSHFYKTKVLISFLQQIENDSVRILCMFCSITIFNSDK